MEGIARIVIIVIYISLVIILLNKQI